MTITTTPCSWADQREPQPAESDLSSALQQFETVSLSRPKETNAQLLTRRENKHPMTIRKCWELVQTLTDSCRVLDVNRTLMGRYKTL
ncbi:MAG: hypothetical protein LUO93_07350 [Methanomicrobiales archaeon]|nr:hypothetical protein [Methanomicrobiales archaeon]